MINEMTLARLQGLNEAEIADYAGSINTMRKRLETIEALVKTELMRRDAEHLRADGKITAQGLDYTITVAEVNQSRLDTEAVRKYLGPAAGRFEKNTVSIVMRCNPIGNTSAAAA